MIEIIIFSIMALLMIGFMIYAVITQDKQPQNIAVYSGSFNPIHIGHKTIIEYLSKNFNWTYLIVTPQNPLKDNIEIPFKKRIEMVNEALYRNNIFNVISNSIEKDMLPPYYTINTLRKLKENEPNNNFKLVIGADCLNDIKKWYSYQDILIDFGVIVFPRDGLSFNELNDIKASLLKENNSYNIDIINIKTPDISSTEIRKAIKNGENVHNLLM